MEILLFGGTVEGRTLARRLIENDCAVTACVATEYGAELVPERRGYSLQVQAAGGKMTIPVQGGQIEKVRNFLDHLSRRNDQISQFH